MKQNGHDSVRFNKSEWGFFKPEQIKSAIGNSGAFDPSDSNILRNREKYPLADKSEWYGNADYKQGGGKLVHMSPQDYISQVRPLDVDDVSRENIDDLKNHIREGRPLDPLVIYSNGKEDGRHRAHAAKELGIGTVPVLDYRGTSISSPTGFPPVGKFFPDIGDIDDPKKRGV